MQKNLPGFPPQAPVSLRGVLIYQNALDQEAQQGLLEAVRTIVRRAPLYQPTLRSGRKMSVRMSAAGRFGWISDGVGYRYSTRHPDGREWPEIPDSILALWRHFGRYPSDPECCLINYYDATARMGLHQDKDEADLEAPVVSVSLGDDGLFRVGNTDRGGKTESIWLRSGDVAVLGGSARLAHHGVDRIRAGSSDLLRDEGRLNLTLRVVTAVD